MKKRRFISALTSFAVAAGMVANALAMTASAAAILTGDTTMAMTLKAEKSSFTMDEVKAGNAKTTVTMYVENFNDEERITNIKTNFVASDSNIKVSTPKFVEENPGLTAVNYKGNAKYNTAKRRYASYAASGAGFFISMGSKNWLVLDDASKGIVTLDVEFPSTMAAGTYTINFDSAEVVSAAELRGLDPSDPDYGNMTMNYTESARANAKAATITLGGVTPPEPSTNPTPSASDDKKTYEGEVDFKAGNVEAEPGETVEFPLYVDTRGKAVLGVGFKAKYDDKLTLMGAEQDFGFDCSASIDPDKATYGASVVDDSEPLENDPETPVMILQLKVPDTAKAGDKFEVTFVGSNGAPEPIVQSKKGATAADERYLKPVITPGYITVKGATTPTPSASDNDKKTYEGEVDFKGGNIEAAPGETVEFPLYVDTRGKAVLGVGFKAKYDDKLTLMGAEQDFGFDCSASIDPAKATYGASVVDDSEPLVNDPTTPVMILQLKVPDNAKAGDKFEITFIGSNGAPEPIVQSKKGATAADERYLKPVITPGYITIKGATAASTAVSTAASTPIPTTVSTSATPTPTDPPSSVQIVTSISVVIEKHTEIEKVTSIEKVTEIVPVTSMSVVTSVQISWYGSATDIVPVESYIYVTSIEHLTSIEKVTEVEKVTSIEKVTEVEKVTSIEYVTSYVPVTTYIPVTSYTVVTTLVVVPVTTVSTPNTGGGKIEIELPNIAPDQNQDQWYHSDNVEFFKDGIVVKVNGEDVTEKAKILFNKTPGEVYSGKAGEYKVDFTVEYEGMTETGELTVMIAARGDADLSGGVKTTFPDGTVGYMPDILDAVRIAQALLPSVKGTAGEYKAGQFRNFAADINEKDNTEILDPICIAKYLLKSNKGKPWNDKIVPNYSNLIKD